jgi:hypothetical protein
MKYAKIDINGTGNEVVVAGVAGKKIRVLDYIVSSAFNAVLTWKSNSGSALSGAMHVASNGNLVAVGGYQTPAGMFGLMETAAGEGLVLDADKACGGHLTYQEISV